MTDHRFHSSLALYQQPFRHGEPGHDKIFLLGRVRMFDCHTEIAIDRDTPTVAFDNEIKLKFGLGTDIPTVTEMQAQYEPSAYSLLSAGASVWVYRRGQPLQSVLLEKSGGLGWTEPAGRCDRDPERAIDHEATEELLMMFRRAGQTMFGPVVIAGSIYDGQPSWRYKAMQMRMRGEALNRASIPPTMITGRFNPEANGTLAYFQPLPHERGLYRPIHLILDGIERPPFRAIPLIVPANNTLEIRRSVMFPCGADDTLICIDGEHYNRPTGLFTLDTMLEKNKSGELKTRPGLTAYLDAVRSQKLALG